MKEEIVQIIPAPAGMNAYYHDETATDDTAIAQPVCCMALVKVTGVHGTDMEVRPMVMMHEGYADFPTESSDFIGVDFE